MARTGASRPIWGRALEPRCRSKSFEGLAGLGEERLALVRPAGSREQLGVLEQDDGEVERHADLAEERGRLAEAPLGDRRVVVTGKASAEPQRMRGMDAGPGTELGSAGWYLGIWVTMTAAMMLPSATPMVLLYSKAASAARRPGLATALFVAGYLIAWTAYGLVAYGIFRLVRGLDPSFLAWDRAGPEVAGAAIALAGICQLTPLKRVCLHHCRTPLSFVMHNWRDGPVGAVRMGVEHGAWCVGCCWALMVVLFAVGVMSITWMVVVAAIVFAEKVLPVGERVARAVAVVLVVAGIWVAVAPGSVPGLTRPGAESKMDRMLPTPAHLDS